MTKDQALEIVRQFVPAAERIECDTILEYYNNPDAKRRGDFQYFLDAKKFLVEKSETPGEVKIYRNFRTYAVKRDREYVGLRYKGQDEVRQFLFKEFPELAVMLDRFEELGAETKTTVTYSGVIMKTKLCNDRYVAAKLTVCFQIALLYTVLRGDQ